MVLKSSFVSLAVFVSAAVAADAPSSVGPASVGVEAIRWSGKFVWNELLTSGVPSEAAPFYAGVLGWEAETVGEGAYAAVVMSAHGRPVAGIVHRADSQPGARRARWLAFASVADVAAAVKASTDAGGRVLVPAAAWPGRGEQAVVADVEGAPFGLIAARVGDGGDYAAADGEWIWPILFSRRPEAALEFYPKTLGHEVHPERRTPLFQGDFILSRGVRARAGVMVLPSRSGGRPGWLGLVRVADLEATLTKARELGGRVLHGPTEDLIGGRVAAVADPQGAVFGLVQTTKPASPAVVGEPVSAVAASDGGGADVERPGDRAYAWRDVGFYDAWFDPACIVLPPPMAFRGFGTDGKPMPLLPAEARPAGGR